MNNKYPQIFSSPHFVSFLLMPYLQCHGLEAFSDKFKFYGILWWFVYIVAFYLVFKSKDKHWNTYVVAGIFILLQYSTYINHSCSGGLLRTIGCISFFVIVDFYLRNKPIVFFKGLIIPYLF